MLDCIPASYQCCSQSQSKAMWAMTRPFENSLKGKHIWNASSPQSPSHQRLPFILIDYMGHFSMSARMCHEWCVVCQKTDYDADIFHWFVDVHIVVLDSFTHFRVIKSDYGYIPKNLTCLTRLTPNKASKMPFFLNHTSARAEIDRHL